MLLVARTDAAHRNLAEQFASRKVEKTYIALVHGSLKQDSGKIDTKITRDPVRRIRMTARLRTRPLRPHRISRTAALREIHAA